MVGELSSFRNAVLPVIAAVGGMAVPVVVALAVGWGDPRIESAWAVPVATDIAFALGVLSLTGSGLPSSARVFLLSLAVVDDLGAILLIAVMFTAGVDLLAAAATAALLALYRPPAPTGANALAVRADRGGHLGGGARMPPGMGKRDLTAVAMLGGVGFTVSLLIADLALDGPHVELVKGAVLVASTLAALLAAVLLVRRSRAHEAGAEDSNPRPASLFDPRMAR